RETQPPHVRDIQQRVADQLDVFGRQLVRIAAGDYDVFEFVSLCDVLERVFPLLGRLGQRDFVDVLGVGADCVRTRAETAVDRTRIERQEERLVDVAVDEARNRGVVL